MAFPHIRTVIHVGRFTENGRRPAAWEDAYYVSSRMPESMLPRRWLQTIRNHWGGCEIRNHWRKDACLFEDKTRSRNPHIVANLMLLRNLALQLYAHHGSACENFNRFVEDVASCPTLASRLIHSSA